jgi:two-component system chemotaxis response regulator CheY
LGIKAIVVDDDKDVQDVFIELLEINNVHVIGTGHNGKNALELYQTLCPDIVFMDVKMPEYDGFYGLEKIREYDPNALVVLVTGSEGVEDKINYCGATAIVPKPIHIDKIIGVINRFCIQINKNNALNPSNVSPLLEN